MNQDNKCARRWLGLAVGCILLIAACAATTPAEDKEAAAAASAGGQTGNELWAERCALCHNSRSPASLSDTQWNVVLRHMRIRANLTGAEETKIREFLQSAN